MTQTTPVKAKMKTREMQTRSPPKIKERSI